MSERITVKQVAELFDVPEEFIRRSSGVHVLRILMRRWWRRRHFDAQRWADEVLEALRKP